MDFLTSIKEKARASKKTIVLPESLEKRNLEAAAVTLKEGFADIVLIGNREEIIKAAQEAGGFDVSGATIIDPESYEKDLHLSRLKKSLPTLFTSELCLLKWELPTVWFQVLYTLQQTLCVLHFRL